MAAVWKGNGFYAVYYDENWGNNELEKRRYWESCWEKWNTQLLFWTTTGRLVAVFQSVELTIMFLGASSQQRWLQGGYTPSEVRWEGRSKVLAASTSWISWLFLPFAVTFFSSCGKNDSVISSSFYLCFCIPLFIETYQSSFCLFCCQKISVLKRKVNDMELKRTHLDLIIIKVLGTNDFEIHIVAYASLECFILSSERHHLFKLCSCMTSGLKSIITYIISFLNAGLSVGLLTLLYKTFYF